MKNFFYKKLTFIALAWLMSGLCTACGSHRSENPLEPANPDLSPVNPPALERLLERARETRSDALGAHDLTPGRCGVGPVIGIEARGYPGQRLLILRDQRLIAVRQIRYRNHRRNEEDDFKEFTERVMELLPPFDKR